MNRLINHVPIWLTIGFTVYSQLIMRWQVSAAGSMPADGSGKLQFVLLLLRQPWVLSALVASFLAGVSWMLAMSRFELSYAFPFMGLNFVLIGLAGIVFFGEALTFSKLAGSLLVIAGIVVLARG